MPYKDPDKQREADRRWREANPEKQREATRRWHEANPEWGRKHSRRWRGANLEKARAREAAYRAANREARRTYMAAYKALKRRLHAWTPGRSPSPGLPKAKSIASAMSTRRGTAMTTEDRGTRSNPPRSTPFKAPKGSKLGRGLGRTALKLTPNQLIYLTLKYTG
jgi:hypothetical protein